MRVESVKDIETFIKLHVLLAGDPTDIHKVTMETVGVIVNLIVVTVQEYVTDPGVIESIEDDLRDQIKQIPPDNGQKQLTETTDSIFQKSRRMPCQ